MGRCQGLGRNTVEDTGGFSIADLKAWGFIHEGATARGSLTLSRNGEKTGSIGLEVRLDKSYSYAEFDYRLDGKPVKYSHGLMTVRPHFGGRRYYFRCRNCLSCVTALYLRGGYYACRKCHGLVYESSQKHNCPYAGLTRALTLEKRAEKLRERGHPRKANRLLERAGQLSMMGWADMMSRGD